VAGGYAVVLMPALWSDEAASIVAAVAVVGILLRRHATAAGRVRRARRLALASC
jgi:hypothetical protein